MVQVSEIMDDGLANRAECLLNCRGDGFEKLKECAPRKGGADLTLFALPMAPRGIAPNRLSNQRRGLPILRSVLSDDDSPPAS